MKTFVFASVFPWKDGYLPARRTLTIDDDGTRSQAWELIGFGQATADNRPYTLTEAVQLSEERLGTDRRKPR